MHLVTRALVLRETPYKEADKILTLLTAEAGKLTASARGVRRKNSPIAAGTQLLCWSELVLYDFQGRWTVKEAAVERQFRGVREDLERFSLACYFAEAAELLAVEGETAPEVLSLLLNCLHVLDTRPQYPHTLVKAVFELRLMCLSGYGPLVEDCVVCAQRPVEAFLHLREGGLHCAACRGEMGEGISVPLTPGALAALRHIAACPAGRLFSFRLEGQSQECLADCAEAYLAAQLERGFRTLDFYKQMTLGGSRDMGDT